MNDWQKGYELEFLKDLAQPFKLAYKGIAQGPFGTPKERDVAAALYMNRCTYTVNDKDCTAVAIWQRVSANTENEDFSGRKFVVWEGDIMVKDFAFLPGSEAHAARIIAHLIKSGRAIWWRIPEEYSALKAMIEQNARYITTKISAYSDVTGFYFTPSTKYPGQARNLPGAFHRSEELSICQIEPEFLSPFEIGTIEAELENFAPVWADHYSSYNKRNSWSAFALRGYDSQDPNFIIKPAEMSREWKAENPERMKAVCDFTPAAAHFKDTLFIVGRLPGAALDRVRFMRLAAKKGELTRHADITDREAGVAPGRVARLHIPIKTNPAVIFRSWDSRGACHSIHMEHGSLYYLDQRKPHTAVNQGSEDRIHLVVDVVSSPRLQSLIGEGLVPDVKAASSAQD